MDKLELKLQRLRELWKTDTNNRKVIELQARCIIRAIKCKKIWRGTGSLKDKKFEIDVIKAIF